MHLVLKMICVRADWLAYWAQWAKVLAISSNSNPGTHMVVGETLLTFTCLFLPQRAYK